VLYAFSDQSAMILESDFCGSQIDFVIHLWHCRQNRCNSVAIGALSTSNHSDVPLPTKASSFPKKFEWSREESDPNLEVLLKGMKILLAEDNLVNQKVACQQLKKFGTQVDVVCDGQQCLDTLEVHRDDYDLILMDVQVRSFCKLCLQWVVFVLFHKLGIHPFPHCMHL